MDSIWGDPWADNAKPDLPDPQKNDPVEEKTYKPVKPQTTLFSGGFEDEAGWGDFEESTGFDAGGTEGSENQELGWSAGQGHEEEKDFTNGLAPEPHFTRTNGSGILSPGWGDSHTLQSTPEPLPNDKQNDDASETIPSHIWESPRSSISSIPYAPGSLGSNDIDLGPQSAKHDRSIASATPPRPSTSSTTKTAVSTDSNAFSDIPASPIHHDGPRWERNPSHSDASDDSNNSPDSLRTSFDEAYIPSKQVEDSPLHMDKVEELPPTDAGSLPNSVHVDEKPSHEATQEEKTHEWPETHDSHAVVKGPQFSTKLELVKDIFTSVALSKNHGEANDEVIDSTSTRKAWYRLTRPQTMREFNTGAADDSYVRVSWPRSHVRTETLKIATRWASEDRINGRVVLGGKPGLATFGWDIPSDGSIIPPRPMSMINPLPQRNENGKHHISHQRQSSMPQPSNRTNASPVAQFGWSTSPTSSGSGIIASFGEALESRAMTTASKPQLRVGKQRQVVQRSEPATAHSPLPTTSAPEETKAAPPASGLGLKNKQGIDPPGLSKLDTTESPLNGSPEDDDDDWGEMVKSPSGPPSPVVLPSLPASVVEAKSSNIDEHVPIISTRRRPTLVMAPPAAQSTPDSMLSPARKAAFDAARTTRFLNSQPTRTGSPTIGDNESRSSTPGPRRLSHSPSSPIRASFNVLRSSSTSGSIKSATGVVPIASPSFLEADLSFFETPTQQQSPHPTRDVNTPEQLSAKEEEHAQQIVRNIPNLSFMLR